MKTLTLAAAAGLTLGLSVAQAAPADHGIVLAQQTQTPQQTAPGLMGGGASGKPSQIQSGNDATNPGGLMGGGGSAKPSQKQGGNASTTKTQ